MPWKMYKNNKYLSYWHWKINFRGKNIRHVNCFFTTLLLTPRCLSLAHSIPFLTIKNIFFYYSWKSVMIVCLMNDHEYVLDATEIKKKQSTIIIIIFWNSCTKEDWFEEKGLTSLSCLKTIKQNVAQQIKWGRVLLS